jgi:hypothetical protein
MTNPTTFKAALLKLQQYRTACKYFKREYNRATTLSHKAEMYASFSVQYKYYRMQLHMIINRNTLKHS